MKARPQSLNRVCQLSQEIARHILNHVLWLLAFLGKAILFPAKKNDLLKTYKTMAFVRRLKVNSTLSVLAHESN